MNTWSKLTRVGAVLVLVVSLGAVSAHADTDIFDNTHTYNDSGGGIGSVTIAVDIDKTGGLYLWQYTVTNNSFDPATPFSNGFSGFELALPVFVADFGNVTNPGPGWINNCCSGLPEEWDITNSSGAGIMPGSSGVFSFTTLPRFITTSTGWFHTWEFDSQTFVSFYSLTPGETGPEVPNVLLPPTPEPGTLMLFGSGLVGIAGAIRRRMRS